MTGVSPRFCRHERTAPIEVGGDAAAAETIVVAHLCHDCGAHLDAAWSCPDCVWETTEVPVLHDLHPQLLHMLVVRCNRHLSG